MNTNEQLDAMEKRITALEALAQELLKATNYDELSKRLTDDFVRKAHEAYYKNARI